MVRSCFAPELGTRGNLKWRKKYETKKYISRSYCSCRTCFVSNSWFNNSGVLCLEMGGPRLAREKGLRHTSWMPIRLIRVVLHLVIQSCLLQSLRGLLGLCLGQVKHVLLLLWPHTLVALLSLERILFILLLLLV